MIRTNNKQKFLKSEHNEWEYWKDFSYAEYLRENEEDAVKCECGIYHWEGYVKPCKCKSQSATN